MPKGYDECARAYRFRPRGVAACRTPRESAGVVSGNDVDKPTLTGESHRVLHDMYAKFSSYDRERTINSNHRPLKGVELLWTVSLVLNKMISTPPDPAPPATRHSACESLPCAQHAASFNSRC